MTQSEGIALRESLRLHVSEPEPESLPQDTEHNASNLDQTEPRQWESGRKRVCVLVGSAILQLPIWGRQNHT